MIWQTDGFSAERTSTLEPPSGCKGQKKHPVQPFPSIKLGFRNKQYFKEHFFPPIYIFLLVSSSKRNGFRIGSTSVNVLLECIEYSCALTVLHTAEGKMNRVELREGRSS